MSHELHPVTDDQVVEHTGHDLEHWNHVLIQFHAQEKNPVDIVHFLETVHHLSKEWSRTIATRFLKQKLGSWKD